MSQPTLPESLWTAIAISLGVPIYPSGYVDGHCQSIYPSGYVDDHCYPSGYVDGHSQSSGYVDGHSQSGWPLPIYLSFWLYGLPLLSFLFPSILVDGHFYFL